MVEMQSQAVNHTTFDTIKTVATMIPYHIMGLRLFSILFKSSGKNVKKTVLWFWYVHRSHVVLELRSLNFYEVNDKLTEPFFLDWSKI